VSVLVYLGPTLPRAEAQALLDARLLPPVRAGDICAAVEEGAELIGIIDGVFEQVPAVRHKEILYALSKGVPVYGASSMGALRAAELSAFGMIGVGEVFERFRDGVYTDDDEVAVSHATEEFAYRPLSEALVNIRAGLTTAVRAGAISAATEEALLELAKAHFYPDRSWPALLRSAREQGLPDCELQALDRSRRAHPCDLKGADARALLVRMDRDLRAGTTRHQANFDFEPTRYFRELLVRRREGAPSAQAGGGGSTGTEVQ
jgi:hypothetical protein